MSRRAQDASYGGVALVGVLGELAQVQDDKLAPAIAALLDDDLQALVVETEKELEVLRAFCIASQLDSLKIISLQSAAGVRLAEERGAAAARASKHGGTMAYDAIRVRGSLAPALQQLWWRVLQGAVIFESEQAMFDYKGEFGRTAAFVVPQVCQKEPCIAQKRALCPPKRAQLTRAACVVAVSLGRRGAGAWRGICFRDPGSRRIPRARSPCPARPRSRGITRRRARW